jgi:hypothetical protein
VDHPQARREGEDHPGQKKRYSDAATAASAFMASENLR